MCGIAGAFGVEQASARVHAMLAAQKHRGPNDLGNDAGRDPDCALGNNRLSVIDLSSSGHQPMRIAGGRLRISMNGEVYNYRELREELSDFPFQTQTDTEVVLAAFTRWGAACLDRFIGMFAFVVWDDEARTVFAARDRLGVKPLYYSLLPDGGLLLASETRALRASGLPSEPDEVAWATYLACGLNDHDDRTFWKGIRPLAPGHFLTWQNGRSVVRSWYDFGAMGEQEDSRPWETVADDLLQVLQDSVRLRLRADTPIGICLSGGLDSSLLFGLLVSVGARVSQIPAFTFATGESDYDETPWARSVLRSSGMLPIVCPLAPEEVPGLALAIQQEQDAPIGGIPTLAMAGLFERARDHGCVVMLDGQGLDEQWAGYDHYRTVAAGDDAHARSGPNTGTPDCLLPEFRALAQPFAPPKRFEDPLREAQFRDLRFTKLPRALRYNDGISMRSSVELRGPFLDHRLFELALRQSADRKIRGDMGKWLPRQLAKKLLPPDVAIAPKRTVQTPQREWLRGPLAGWCRDVVEVGLSAYGDTWVDAPRVRAEMDRYASGCGDTSYHIWQYVSLGLSVMARR